MNETTNNTPIIARTAMLASLNISRWTGRKFDKQTTSELTSSKGAAADAARVNLVLLKSDMLDAIQTLDNSVRAEYYRVTLPWGDNGDRVMPALKYQEFADFFTDKKTERDGLVDQFVHNYKTEVERSRYRLNSLFDIDNYPDPWDIAEKFDMRFSVRPVPTEDDFRVTLAGPAEAAIKKQVRDDLERLTTQAVGHLWAQVGEMLTTIRDRLNDPGARFKSAMVDNFLQLVNELDKLNVANDPNLDKLRNEVEKNLLALRDPDALRKDEATRAQTVRDCDKVIRQFEGLWG